MQTTETVKINIKILYLLEKVPHPTMCNTEFVIEGLGAKLC